MELRDQIRAHRITNVLDESGCSREVRVTLVFDIDKCIELCAERALESQNGTVSELLGGVTVKVTSISKKGGTE